VQLNVAASANVAKASAKTKRLFLVIWLSSPGIPASSS
jgi:hypothetical protein